MLYLVDANVIMTAANTYYRHTWVPEYWLWLLHHGVRGNIKMPIEIFEEIKDSGTTTSKDELFNWAKETTNRNAILLPGEADAGIVRTVLYDGYSASALTDAQIEGLGRDPFLIAHALAAPSDRCVVTHERSARQKAPHNRKIPDACAALGVKTCTPFEMMVDLGFKTTWNAA